MASGQHSFKYLLYIYCIYIQSKYKCWGFKGKRERAHRLVLSSFYLLIKSQENVHWRQFLLYKICQPPFLISEEKQSSKPINWLKTFVRNLTEISIWNSSSAALLGVSFPLHQSLFQKWPGKEKNTQLHSSNDPVSKAEVRFPGIFLTLFWYS